MSETHRPALEGEVLDDDAPQPGARDVTPGWISRNRQLIRRGRALAQALSVAGPPHLRLALTLAGVAADAALFTEDWRRGAIDRRAARARAARLALEGAALVAASRLAPAILAKQRARLAAARTLARRLDPCPPG